MRTKRYTTRMYPLNDIRERVEASRDEDRPDEYRCDADSWNGQDRAVLLDIVDLQTRALLAVEREFQDVDYDAEEAVDAALTAAGLDTQEKRDVARTTASLHRLTAAADRASAEIAKGTDTK